MASALAPSEVTPPPNLTEPGPVDGATTTAAGAVARPLATMSPAFAATLRAVGRAGRSLPRLGHLARASVTLSALHGSGLLARRAALGMTPAVPSGSVRPPVDLWPRPRRPAPSQPIVTGDKALAQLLAARQRSKDTDTTSGSGVSGAARA